MMLTPLDQMKMALAVALAVKRTLGPLVIPAVRGVLRQVIHGRDA